MLRLSALALAASTTAASAVVEFIEAPPSDATQTRAFVGLNWTFGSNNGPEAVLGVARVKTDSDGDSRGAKLSVHMPLSNGISFGKVKLSGVAGQNDRMGEIGLGFGSAGMFGTAGIWAPYLNAGMDIGFDGSLGGYVGATSLDEWDAPTVPARGDVDG